MLEKLLIGGVLLFIIGLLLVGPILTIVAINHLFGTAIVINFWNWLAVFWLHLLVARPKWESKD